MVISSASQVADMRIPYFETLVRKELWIPVMRNPRRELDQHDLPVEGDVCDISSRLLFQYAVLV